MQIKFIFDDKAKHVLACMAIAFVCGMLGYFFTPITFFQALVIGFTCAVLAGAGKELIHDKLMGLGAATWADFIASLYGSFAGTIFLAMVLGFILSN